MIYYHLLKESDLTSVILLNALHDIVLSLFIGERLHVRYFVSCKAVSFQDES